MAVAYITTGIDRVPTKRESKTTMVIKNMVNGDYYYGHIYQGEQ